MIRLTHQWRKVEGIYVVTLVGIHWGYDVFGITILNFVLEIEL